MTPTFLVILRLTLVIPVKCESVCVIALTLYVFATRLRFWCERTVAVTICRT